MGKKEDKLKTGTFYLVAAIGIVLMVFSVLGIFIHGMFTRGSENYLSGSVTGISEYYEGKWNWVDERGNVLEKDFVISKTGTKLAASSGQDVILETTLPSETEGKSLMFWNLGHDVLATVEGDARLNYDTSVTRGESDHAPYQYLFIRLKGEDAGKVLRLILYHNNQTDGHIGEVWYGEASMVMVYLLRDYQVETIWAIIVLFTGIVVVIIGVILSFRDNSIYPVFSLGIGITFLALWVLCNSQIRQFLFPNVSLIRDISSFIVAIITLPFLLYLDSLQKYRYHSLYLWSEVAVIISYVLYIIAFYTSWLTNAILLYFAETVAVVVVVIMCITIVMDIRKKKLQEYLIPTIGLVCLGLSALLQLVVYVGFTNQHFNATSILIGLTATLVLAIANTYHQHNRMKAEKIQAEESNKAKTAFLSSMSHDIRTPMNAIVGFTDLAIQHQDDKVRVEDYLSKIKASSHHLLELINDVLDMSRIESGKIVLEEKETDLGELMVNLKNIIQPQVNEKSFSLFMDTVDVKDEKVICDSLRLNQILINIVGNSLKYTEEGGRITILLRQVPSSKEGYGKYIFTCSDTGIGISEEYQKKLFTPFERDANEKTKKIQGTGLGLSIVKRMVDLMQGTIECESELGKGSTFTITMEFPLADSTIPSLSLNELGNIRALVVDDDQTSCESLSEMVSRCHIPCDYEMDSKKALENIKAQIAQNGCPYNLFFVDLKMSGVDGVSFIKEIKPLLPKALFIITTAYDYGVVEEQASSLGIGGFLQKPVFYSDVCKLLSGVNEEKETNPDGSESFREKFRGKRILLVEDNELNREIATEYLTSADFVIETAENGKIAVDMVSAKPSDYYDVILMDIQMPILNGYEASKAIRALPDVFRSRIPIVAMTADAFAEDKKQAFAVGMNAHISKPIDINVLYDTLNKILK